MNAVLFLLVAIFGHNVEGTKIRAIRRRTYQYLPTEVPEVPSQTQYNWEQWRQKPVYRNGRLIYSYDDPNGVRFNMFGGGPYWNRNYVDGRQIYQSLGQSGSGSGSISLGQTLQGTDSSEGLNGVQLGYSENGVRIVPNLGLIRQNFANSGKISLSSDLSGAHSSASAYSSQIAQNIGRSKPEIILTDGDNSGKMVIVNEANESTSDNVLNIINANNADNSDVVSLVNPDNLNSENKEAIHIIDQSDRNQIIDNASKNIIQEILMKNQENGGLIDSGNIAILPDDSAMFTVDQTKPNLANDAPIKDIADEINVNNKYTTTFGQYWPKLISPDNKPSPHRRPNLWRYYKYIFNGMRKRVNGNENRKLSYNYPIDKYQQPDRQYYDVWRQYISNSQSPPHYHYNPYAEYADWPKKQNRLTPVICRKKHINMLPGKKVQYYDSEDVDGRPLLNKRNYVVPKNIYNHLETPTDDYVDEENPERVSMDYLYLRDQERSNANDDTAAVPYDVPEDYKNIYIPKVRPMPSNEDTPSDIFTLPPYDPAYANLIPREYNNILIPKVRLLPTNEDTQSTTYTPLPYGYNTIIPKVLETYPAESNDDESDVYNSPVFPYFKPDIVNDIPLDPVAKPKPDYIQAPTDLDQIYFSNSNEDISGSQETNESSEEDDRYDAGKDTAESPDSRIVYINSNTADSNVHGLTPESPDKDTLKIFGAPWEWNWNNKPKEQFNIQSITLEQYIKQAIDDLILHLLKLYYSDCTKENEEKLLRRFKAIIDNVKSQHCDTRPSWDKTGF